MLPLVEMPRRCSATRLMSTTANDRARQAHVHNTSHLPPARLVNHPTCTRCITRRLMIGLTTKHQRPPKTSRHCRFSGPLCGLLTRPFRKDEHFFHIPRTNQLRCFIAAWWRSRSEAGVGGCLYDAGWVRSAHRVFRDVIGGATLRRGGKQSWITHV